MQPCHGCDPGSNPGHRITKNKMVEKFLTEMKEGQEGNVISILDGITTTKRLADLGIIQNTKIKVLKKAPFGPIEVIARNSRLVIGRHLASKILVRLDE